MSYKDTLALIKERKDREFNGITTNFNTLKKVLPAWDHRTTTIVSGATGSGKTSFAFKHAVLDIVAFFNSNPEIDGHVYYLSLELTKHELYFKLFCGMLEKHFNKQYTRDVLLGYTEVRLTDEEYYYLEDVCKPVLEFIDEKVTIIDTATTPNRALVYLRQEIKEVDNPLYFNFIIADTVNAFSGDAGEKKMESIKKWNQDYALKVFRNELNCVVLNVQQQDKQSTARAFSRDGDNIEEKYTPTLETLGNDKEASNSANLILSIFNPITYGIREWGIDPRNKYSVGKFEGGLRFIYVNKNNFGDNNLVVPYYFNGAHNTWDEILEEPIDFRKHPELYKKYMKKNT